MRRAVALLTLIVLAAGPIHSQITVASAADLQFAMVDLAAEFKHQTGKEVKTVFGSSGNLTNQVRTGAPFDVFIAANMTYPDSLYKWGYAAERPRLCAYGVLVLWTVKNLDLSRGIGALCDGAVAKIALPDPRHAPYGQAAVQAMTKQGVRGALERKFVFADNVSQAAQYISSASADIGFNAKSIVISPQMKGKGTWVEVDDTLYDPIAQGVIVTKYGQDNNPESSRAFLDFLFTEEARSVLVKYGFLIALPGTAAEPAR
jgi:molybdate transport system substrate-binding protein